MIRLFAFIATASIVAVSRADAQAKLPVVRIVARNYAFTVPRNVPSGLVRLRVVNHGSVPHYARVVRLEQGKTVDDFNTWRKRGGRPPTWYVPVGGPAPIAPGDSAEVALTLMPGRHIVFCTYPLPGGTSVHLDSGMVREVVVTKPPAAVKATPNVSIKALDSDGTLIIGEYGYSTLPPLAPGHRQIRVTNAGRLAHQALLIRLPDGVKPNAELAWFRSNYTGTRPGIPAGGLLQVRPGETAWFSVWLKPGRYMLVCGFLDGSTHHFDKGLMRVIEVKRS